MTDVSSFNVEKQPLVSIGIPTYNRPVGLRKALECATNQTYRNLEIIVSDNSSQSNKSEQVVREFMGRDSRVSYFHQSKNIGAISNFQFVLDKAKGEYFIWFADDDLCEKNFVNELVSCIEKDTRIALAMTDVRIIDDDDFLVKIETLDSIRECSATSGNNHDKMTGLFFRYPTSNIFFCIYGLYRTNIAKLCPLYTRSYRNYLFANEVPFLAKIASKGKIVSIPGPLKLYRTHADSAFIKEQSGITYIDKLIRDVEIRFQLIGIALSSKLILKKKLSLCGTIFKSGVENYGIMVYRIIVQIIKKRKER